MAAHICNIIQIHYFIPQPDTAASRCFTVTQPVQHSVWQLLQLDDCGNQLCVCVLPASCEESERCFPPQSAAPGPAQGSDQQPDQATQLILCAQTVYCCFNGWKKSPLRWSYAAHQSAMHAAFHTITWDSWEALCSCTHTSWIPSRLPLAFSRFFQHHARWMEDKVFCYC